MTEAAFRQLVGSHNLVMISDLQRHGRPGLSCCPFMLVDQADQDLPPPRLRPSSGRSPASTPVAQGLRRSPVCLLSLAGIVAGFRLVLVGYFAAAEDFLG